MVRNRLEKAENFSAQADIWAVGYIFHNIFQGRYESIDENHEGNNIKIWGKKNNVMLSSENVAGNGCFIILVSEYNDDFKCNFRKIRI